MSGDLNVGLRVATLLENAMMARAKVATTQTGVRREHNVRVALGHANTALVNMNDAIILLRPAGIELWAPDLVGARDALRGAVYRTEEDYRSLVALHAAVRTPLIKTGDVRRLKAVPNPHRVAQVGIQTRWNELRSLPHPTSSELRELDAVGAHLPFRDLGEERLLERANQLVSQAQPTPQDAIEVSFLLGSSSRPYSPLSRALDAGRYPAEELGRLRTMLAPDRSTESTRLLDLAKRPAEGLTDLDRAEFAELYVRAQVDFPVAGGWMHTNPASPTPGIERYQAKALAAYEPGSIAPATTATRADARLAALRSVTARPVSSLSATELEQLRTLISQTPGATKHKLAIDEPLSARIKEVLDPSRTARPATADDLAEADRLLEEFVAPLATPAETSARLRAGLELLNSDRPTSTINLANLVHTNGMGDLTPREQLELLAHLAKKPDPSVPLAGRNLVLRIARTADALGLPDEQLAAVVARMAEAIPEGQDAMARRLVDDLRAATSGIDLASTHVPRPPLPEVADTFSVLEDLLVEAASAYTLRPVSVRQRLKFGDNEWYQIEDAVKHRPPSADALRALEPHLQRIDVAASHMGGNGSIRLVQDVASGIEDLRSAISTRRNIGRQGYETPFHQLGRVGSRSPASVVGNYAPDPGV